MSATPAPERRTAGRRAPREPLRALLALEADVLTLSPSGMCVGLEFPPTAGSRHVFSLVVAQEWLEITGVVRSVAPDPGGAGYRVGVEFEGLGPRAQVVLESFVQERLGRR